MMGNHILQLRPDQLQSKSTGELFTVARSLTEGSGISAFSVIHEELAPGRRASSPHTHTKLDELYLVLKGAPTVHLGGERRVLGAGDYVIFKAGPGEAHWLENESESPVELLRVAGAVGDDVVEYATRSNER